MEVITLAFKKRDFPITYSINRAWHLHNTYNLGTRYQFESSSSIKFKYAVYQCSYCTLTTHIYFQCYCSRVSLTFYYLRYYYIVALRYNFQEREQLTSSRMAQSKMSSLLLLLLFSLLASFALSHSFLWPSQCACHLVSVRLWNFKDSRS